MITRDNLHVLKSVIGVSQKDLDRLYQILPTDIETWKYINHKRTCLDHHQRDSQAAIQEFCGAYQRVADPSWPAVTCINDFYELPAQIQKECQDEHRLHPKIYFNENLSRADWVPDGPNSYHLDEIIRAHYVVNRNHDMIAGKKVLDFPSSFGNIAFFMSKSGFEHLTLADVRSEALALANECMHLLDVPETKWCTTQADLHDLPNNTALCKNFDTLLCAGVFYHIHNHFDVLKSIADSAIENIIIETEENFSIKDSKEAMIWWETEKTDSWVAGWYSGQPTVLVGYPNSQWFDLCMEIVGYHRVRPAEYFCLTYPSGPVVRSTHVFKKNV